MKRIAIMVSGSGTNMENLAKEMRAGRIEAEPALVICDRPGIGAIARAERLELPALVIDRKTFPGKKEFEAAIIEQVDKSRIDLIVLAGFMRLLSDEFVNRYWGRVINIHPSLLPAFPGAHGIRDAFEAKVKTTGVTVHFVDTGVDTGSVILQEEVPVRLGDTLETLEARVHEAEYRVYPEALRRVLSGQVLPPPHSKKTHPKD